MGRRNRATSRGSRGVRFESHVPTLHAAAREAAASWIYFLLVMLGLYLLALVLSFIMLISPGKGRKGRYLLYASIVLPLAAAMSVLSDVEHFFVIFIKLLETYSPWSFILVFLAAWLTITLLLYSILRNGPPLNNLITRLLPPIVGAYAAFHLSLFISLAGVALAGYAALGIIAVVLFFHLYIARHIIRSARKFTYK